MDEPDFPTAAELGVTDAEYERILRDLRHKHGVELPALAAAPTAPPSLRKGWPFALLALAAAVVLVVPRLGLFPDREPDPVYAFTEMQGDRPVGFSSCRMIQVAVYPAGGPPDAERLVREAVAQARAASGLDIVVTGAYGGHAPNWNFEAAPVSASDPVSISWQDASAIAELTDEVAGLGGSPVVAGPDGVRYRIAGTVALSRDYYSYLAGKDDHAEELAVILHELGHVLGLAHVDSPRELMYDGNNGTERYGPGDLEGLRQLGNAPCV
jgi:Matrixin